MRDRLRHPVGPRPYLVEEVKANSVVGAAIHRVDSEEAVCRLDEEAAQALHHAGADPDVGAAPVKLRLQLRGAQQWRLEEEVVPAYMITCSCDDPTSSSHMLLSNKTCTMAKEARKAWHCSVVLWSA